MHKVLRVTPVKALYATLYTTKAAAFVEGLPPLLGLRYLKGKLSRYSTVTVPLVVSSVIVMLVALFTHHEP